MSTMNVDARDKAVIESIIQVFETGKVSKASYGTVTLLQNDKGRLTYGRHQASLTSGGVFAIVNRYIDAHGKYAEPLRPYLDDLKGQYASVDHNADLKSLLAKAGDDPVMQRVQDEYFDEMYFKRAVDKANVLGMTEELSLATLYDGLIHGSWQYIREQADSHGGSLLTSGEKNWVRRYLAERKAWLSRKGKPLSNTLYRAETFEKLIALNNWDLNLPLTAHGFKLTEENALRGIDVDTAEVPPTVPPAPDTPAEDDETTYPTLSLRKPMMTGKYVLLCQHALISRGVTSVNGKPFKADGWFGQATETAVIAFQRLKKLYPDGVVGPRTWDSLID